MRIASTYATPIEAHVALSRVESAGIAAGGRDELTVPFFTTSPLLPTKAP